MEKRAGYPVNVVHVVQEDAQEKITPLTRRPYKSGPQRILLEGEATLGMKDGYLVAIIDHEFHDIPNWVEYNTRRKMVIFTHQNGDVDEIGADIKDEYLDALRDMKKILVVSRDGSEKIVHFLPFLNRGQ